jgi:hypothetical protein
VPAVNRTKYHDVEPSRITKNSGAAPRGTGLSNESSEGAASSKATRPLWSTTRYCPGSRSGGREIGAVDVVQCSIDVVSVAGDAAIPSRVVAADSSCPEEAVSVAAIWCERQRFAAASPQDVVTVLATGTPGAQCLVGNQTRIKRAVAAIKSAIRPLMVACPCSCVDEPPMRGANEA